MSWEDDRAQVEAALPHLRPSANGWRRGRCPLCLGKTGKDDRRGSLGVHAVSGRYNCFKCGASGRLAGGVDLEPEPSAPVAGPPPMEPPPGFAPLAEPAMSLEPARRYLLGRGVGPRLWSAAGIGACSSGRWAGRVIVPILDLAGLWRGWVGRVWRKRAAVPYLYPPGMERAKLLYNPGALLVETDVPLMVVEGVLDALALWPDGVAVLGKPSQWQVEQLAGARRPVAIVMDGDAWEEGLALSWRLRFDGQRAGNVRLPPTLDPDEVPKDELLAAARASLEVDCAIL